MPRDWPQAVRGFVIDTATFGEADKLVTLYCHELGRITAIAKGALKSKKRFVNKLEPYSHLALWLQPPRNGSSLFLLREAELLNAHIHIRRDYRRYVVASYFCELLLLLTGDQDPDTSLYTLLGWTLDGLNTLEQPLRIMPLATLHLLRVLGYQPELTRCSRCRQPIHPPRTYSFLAGNGGLLCDLCHPTASGAPRLSLQTIHILATALSLRPERLRRLHVNERTLHEATAALHAYTLHLLQRDIHAYSAFRQLIDIGNKARRLPPGHAAEPSRTAC